MLDDIGPGLDEARPKIEATRDELQAVLDRQETPDQHLTALMARLGRMAAEVERVESKVAARLPTGKALARAK